MEKIGYETENDIVELILQGFDVENNRFDSHEEYGSSLQNLLKLMAKEKDENGEQIEDYKWTYGKEEFTETLKKPGRLLHVDLQGSI